MALRPGKTVATKEVKKASYYVWFLGAKESGGLRGDDHIRPAVRHLIDREAEVEPLKVTLQVSSKGLKIIQNESRGGSGRGRSDPATATTKHFIPDHSITCVTQEPVPDDDVVACILLIYNPVSKCPVHVHAYRCDSVDTATLLRQHMQQLIERPENQRKFAELEIRLRAKGLVAPAPNALSGKQPCNSDGQSVRTESDTASGGSAGSDKDIYALDDRMSNLYDSLAAELREKLNNKKNNGPLLLPPRDYDTNLRARSGKTDPADSTTPLRQNSHETSTGETKRSQTTGPGRTPYTEEHNSSGKSSGIGSDEAPSSPTHERDVVGGPVGVRHSGRRHEPVVRDVPVRAAEYEPPVTARRKTVDRHAESSSDEEWEANRDPQAKSERDMMLVQSPTANRRPLSAAVRGGYYGGRQRSRERRDTSPHARPISPVVPAPVTHKERFYDRDRGRNWSPQQPIESSRRSRHSPPETETVHRPRELLPPSQRRPISPDDASGLSPERVHRRGTSAGPSRDGHDRPHLRSSWEMELDDRAGPRPIHSGSRDLLASRRSSPSAPSNGSYHPQLVTSKSFDDKRHHRKSADDFPPPYQQRQHDDPRDHHHYDVDNYRHHRDDRNRNRVASPTTPSSRGPTSPMQSPVGPPIPAVFRDAYVPLPRIKRIDSGGGGGHSSSSSGINQRHPPSPAHPQYPPSAGQSTQQRGYQELPDEKRFPGLDRNTARMHHHLLNGGITGHQNGGAMSGQQRYPTPPWNANRGEQSHEREQDLKHGSRPEWEVEESREQRDVGRHRANGRPTASHLPPPHYPSGNRPPDYYGSDAPPVAPSGGGMRQELVRRYMAADDDPPARSADVDKRFYRYGSSGDPDYRQSHRVSSSSGYRNSNY